MSYAQASEAYRKNRLISYWLYKNGLHNQNIKNAENSEKLPVQSDQLQKLCQILQYTPDNISAGKFNPEIKNNI